MDWLELSVLMLPLFSFVVSDNMDTFWDSAVANVFIRKNNVQRVSEVVLTVARNEVVVFRRRSTRGQLLRFVLCGVRNFGWWSVGK